MRNEKLVKSLMSSIRNSPYMFHDVQDLEIIPLGAPEKGRVSRILNASTFNWLSNNAYIELATPKAKSNAQV